MQTIVIGAIPINVGAGVKSTNPKKEKVTMINPPIISNNPKALQAKIQFFTFAIFLTLLQRIVDFVRVGRR